MDNDKDDDGGVDAILPIDLPEGRIHSLRVGSRNFFFSCGFVSVFGSGGK
jgi:hypothetical protein